MSALKASLWLHPRQQGGAQPSLLDYHENASPSLITTSMLRQPHPPSTQQKPVTWCKWSTGFQWRLGRTGVMARGVLVIGSITNGGYKLDLLLSEQNCAEKNRERREQNASSDHTVAAKDPPQFY